jgi:hypothetical protein
VSDDGPHFIFGGSLPPEIAQQIEEARDRQNMENKDWQLRTREFLDSLSIEHLLTFRDLMHMAGADESGRYSSYYEGWITSILHYKFQVCTSCGKDHADEDLKALTVVPEPEPESQEIPGQEELLSRQDVIDLDKMTAPVPAELLYMRLTPEAYDAKMEEYRVRTPMAGEVQMEDGEAPVICKDCGSLYQSLDDRIVKAPDDCWGCIEKAKWG